MTTESTLDPKGIEHVRQITLAVLKTLEEAQRPARQAPRGFAYLKVILEFLGRYPIAVTAVASVVVALVGWRIFHVSPLHALKELADMQEEQEFRRKLVDQHLALGNDLLSMGQVEAAQAEFKQASDLGTHNADAQFGLLKSSVLRPIGAKGYDPEIEERQLSAILEYRPGDTHALAYLGDVYSNVDPKTALSFYVRALRSDSTNAVAYRGAGTLYDQLGMRDSALAMYERWNASSPWNQVALNNLGYQYYQRGDYPKALEHYALMIRLGGNFLLTYYMLANTQLMMGDAKSAYQNLQSREDDLRDSVMFTMPNSNPWFFHVGSADPAYLSGYKEKAAYGFYLMAIAAYLSNNERSARTYLGEVKQLRLPMSRAVDAIVRADLKRLTGAHKEWRTKVNRLELMIWPNRVPG